MNSKIRRLLAVAIFAALTLIPFAPSGSGQAAGYGGPMISHAITR